MGLLLIDVNATFAKNVWKMENGMAWNSFSEIMAAIFPSARVLIV